MNTNQYPQEKMNHEEMIKRPSIDKAKELNNKKNNNKKENDNMEMLNEMLVKYEKAIDDDKEQVAAQYLKAIQAEGYAVQLHENGKYELIKIENNNEKGNDNMKNTIVYSNIDEIINTFFAENLDRDYYKKINDTTLQVNVNMFNINEEQSEEEQIKIATNYLKYSAIACELDNIQENMKKTYPGFEMHIEYDRNFVKKQCQIFKSCYTNRERIKRYNEEFAIYNYITFDIFDKEDEEGELYLHYVLYNLDPGKNEELVNKIKMQNKIASKKVAAISGIKQANNIVSASLDVVKEVAPEVGKTVGKLVEVAGDSAVAVAAPVLHSAIKVFNNTASGQNIDEDTKAGIAYELNRSKAIYNVFKNRKQTKSDKNAF